MTSTVELYIREYLQMNHNACIQSILDAVSQGMYFLNVSDGVSDSDKANYN